MKRTILIYSVLLFIGGLAIYIALGWGGHSARSTLSDSSPAAITLRASNSPAASPSIWSALRENIETPLSRLLLQFIAILTAARTLGAIFRRIGQPSVMGELTAGILFGPSLFGWIWPKA